MCGSMTGKTSDRTLLGKGNSTKKRPVYQSRCVEKCLVSSGLRCLKLMASVSSKEARLFNCLR